MPLLPEEFEAAEDLRKAALGGDDFRGMMTSIREAGFAIRPRISVSEKEPGYVLLGFSFMRGSVHLPASHAGLSIWEQPDNPRAPKFPEDGPFLMSLAEEYQREKGAEIAARKDLIRELREMAETCATTRDLAVLLAHSGMTLTERRDTITEYGQQKTRSAIGLKRGDVEVMISGTRNVSHQVGTVSHDLLRAAKVIISALRKQAEKPVPEIEETLSEPAP